MRNFALAALAALGLMACAPAAQTARTCTVFPADAMVRIPAGHVARQTTFQPEEHIGGNGDVAAFSLDAHEVTNAQYAAFVAATHYITVAERAGPDSQRFGAAVFDRAHGGWRLDAQADWRHPEGPESSIEGRDAYPVVAIAFEDAQAYAQWAGRRLPTENEWEFAMRGDAPAPADISAEAFDAEGRPVANTWQGFFPVQDTADDGYAGLAPVGCFPPNARGLYDMVGNVWEWTSDVYVGDAGVNDVGREMTEAPRVLKGGSNLCAQNFCARFRSGSRQPGDPGLGMSHVGFRTAASL